MQTIAFEALQGLTGRLAVLGLLHSLWIGFVIASLVALAFQACPRLSHRAQHFVLLMALSLVMGLPAVVTPLHHASVRRPTRSPEQHGSNWIVSDATTIGFAQTVPDHSKGALSKTPIKPASPLSALAVAISQSIATVDRLQPILLAVWVVGASALGGFLTLAAIAVHRMCREALPAPNAVALHVAALARLAKLKNPPRVMVHPRLSEPCLCGLFRPLILLPEAWLVNDQPELLCAMLAHELAHAVRLDHFVNLAQRLIEIGLFFNPAMLWLSRSLRRQREYCTDALAVRWTGDPLALARALESVARLRLAHPAAPVPSSALGGTPLSLLPLIQELIGMMPSRPRPVLWPLAALPAAGIVAFIATASGLSQEIPNADKLQPPVETARDQDIKELQPKATSRPAPSNNPPSPTPAQADLDRQICFHIGYFSLDANSWREAAKDRLKLIKQEADVCAWIADAKSIMNLRNTLKSAMPNVPRDVDLNEEMPNGGMSVTVYENCNALAERLHQVHYIAKVDKVEEGDHLSFRPTEKTCEIGSVINVVGSRKGGGTTMTTDIRYSLLFDIQTLTQKETFRNRVYSATYQVPTVIERRCHVSCEIPDDSALLVSVGLHERRRRLSDAGETASEVLGLLGLPPVPVSSVVRERLVMIRPKRLSFESEAHAGSAIKGFFDDTARKR